MSTYYPLDNSWYNFVNAVKKAEFPEDEIQLAEFEKIIGKKAMKKFIDLLDEQKPATKERAASSEKGKKRESLKTKNVFQDEEKKKSDSWKTVPKRYRERDSPPYPAKEYKTKKGFTLGNDGLKYRSAERSNGSWYWKKV